MACFTQILCSKVKLNLEIFEIQFGRPKIVFSNSKTGEDDKTHCLSWFGNVTILL